MSYPLWKRICDIGAGILGCVAFVAILPFVGAFIAIESGFPIIVKLRRISEGREIQVYKFRTMIRKAHGMKKNLAGLNERKDGPLFKIKNDPRITKTGRILRKFRIDEIPQFLNVLMGEMALVGPRPHEPEETAKYPPEYGYIALQRSGITGLSQINGASALTFREELEYDSLYIDRKSFFLDMKIIFITIFILIFNPTGV